MDGGSSSSAASSSSDPRRHSNIPPRRNSPSAASSSNPPRRSNISSARLPISPSSAASTSYRHRYPSIPEDSPTVDSTPFPRLRYSVIPPDSTSGASTSITDRYSDTPLRHRSRRSSAASTSDPQRQSNIPPLLNSPSAASTSDPDRYSDLPLLLRPQNLSPAASTSDPDRYSDLPLLLRPENLSPPASTSDPDRYSDLPLLLRPQNSSSEASTSDPHPQRNISLRPRNSSSEASTSDPHRQRNISLRPRDSSSVASTSRPHRQLTISSPSPENSPSADTTQQLYDSILRASTEVDRLLTLLSISDDTRNSLTYLAFTENPARSLLLSRAAYAGVSAALFSVTSGTNDDPLCNWLYDNYQPGDADLRLVVLSYLPILSAVYLQRIHHSDGSDYVTSLPGFEAVLLAIHTWETRARNGRPVTISIADLSVPAQYLSPSDAVASSNPADPVVKVLSPPLEPQTSLKSTMRAGIIGVAFECYYNEIRRMPKWSKRDFCKFATVWAGDDCPCTSELDDEIELINERINRAFGDGNSREKAGDEMAGDEMEVHDARIPLPWELLRPVLMIIGHCLLEPGNAKRVKKKASIALRFLYARASHDLVPQAILATKSLIKLSRAARGEHAVSTAIRVSS